MGYSERAYLYAFIGMPDIALLTMPTVETEHIAGLVSYIIRPEAKVITGEKSS